MDINLEDDSIKIKRNKFSVMSFDRSNFYKAFDKAVSNDSDYIEYDGTCKYYEINKKGDKLGIVLSQKPKRDKSVKHIYNSYPNVVESLIIKEYTGDMWEVKDRYFLELIRKSEDYSLYDYLNDNVIQYPNTWERNNNYLTINEAIKVDVSKIEKAIIEVLGSETIWEFRNNTDDLYMISFLDKNQLNEHDAYSCYSCCEEIKKGIVVVNENGWSIVPGAIICLNCLPKFMSDYLDYNQKEAAKRIMSIRI